ncbi:EAL domain-containing protein [Cohnella panacarvi]|uniref:EAL domain-containing protein n=1 Tax=Cohnella panacarvi TaxID=400776 RepID=UPI00047CD8C4|nr:EAL domain-containing protein [Cohnella panacarvi]
MNVQAILGRIALAFKMTLPDRSLKFFSPEFTFRRPVLSLLSKELTQSKECYLALFRLDFSHLQDEVSDEVWSQLQDGCRRHLRIAALRLLGDQRVIALHQFSLTDYALIASTDESSDDYRKELVPERLTAVLNEIKQTLEIGLAGSLPEWRNCLHIASAYVPIAKARGDRKTQDSLAEAYQSALALATGVMTSQMKQLRGQMEHILETGNITVLAQPIMDLTSGDVHGWEILTRGPENSILHFPDELFQFASQARLLTRLEFLVVRRSIEEIASRRIREPVFLNVTAVTLSHPLFLSHVLKLLEKHPPLSPGQIYFEITERHEVTNFRAMVDILQTYRKHGFRFAVDDAGSGYSSIQLIGELVPELIKIDRSVIQHVDRIAIKESLLKAFVNAAREIKCELVAEGVEREEEMDVLFRLDIKMGQGFYFAKPNVLLHEHERDMFKETKARIQHRRGEVAS